VKNSTSDLFINNCDEFIYYDDLVRVSGRRPAGRPAPPPPAEKAGPTPKKAPAGKTAEKEAEVKPAEPVEEKRTGPSVAGAFRLLADTIEMMRADRDDEEGIWAGELKLAMKRRNPGFNEKAHGFRSFSDLLLEAEKSGLLKLDAQKEAGGYRVKPVE
jgi:hypothetical protein